MYYQNIKNHPYAQLKLPRIENPDSNHANQFDHSSTDSLGGHLLAPTIESKSQILFASKAI